MLCQKPISLASGAQAETYGSHRTPRGDGGRDEPLSPREGLTHAIKAPGRRPSTPCGGRAQAPLTAGSPVLWLRVGRRGCCRWGCSMNAVGCDRKGDENPDSENRSHFAS